jgi:hypothetical protein
VSRDLLRVLLVGLFLFSLLYFNLIRNLLDRQYASHTRSKGCNWSMVESDQYLCEPTEKWFQRRAFYSEQHEKNRLTMNEYENYFKRNWRPEFQCDNEIRLGDGDGGKWVSLPIIENSKSKINVLIVNMTFEECEYSTIFAELRA